MHTQTAMQTQTTIPVPPPSPQGGGLAETGSQAASTALVGALLVALFVGGFVYLIMRARQTRPSRQ